MSSQLQILAGTVVDDATVGTVSWTNPNNAKVSDAVYAITAGSGTNNPSHYLKATNFGFSIPSGATINGILVEAEELRTGGNGLVWDSSIKIVKSNGSFGTTNKSAGASWPSGTEAYASYGSSSDLWGETWAPADINNSNFGVGISALVYNSSNASVDHIRITVYFSEVSGGSVTGVQSITGISTITL